ncbi:MAG: hypothetical protein FH753_07655 [Firmicutes bacterium]|nr:hypothetical protein [Bacillota bacterium]
MDSYKSLIKTSEKETYVFYLSDKEIYYDYFKESEKSTENLTNEQVIDFSTDIDNTNRIHLIYLNTKGELYYCIYMNTQWKKKILTKLNVKSNRYKNLTLKIIKKNIHIFYNFCNLLTPNVQTIEHIMGDNTKWHKSTVVSTNSGEGKSLFHVDFDNMNSIHLIYKSLIKGIQHIYYTSFNSFLKKWLPYPHKLSESEDNNISPYLFVDKADNIHTVWCSLENNNYKLIYKKLPSISSNKNRWQSNKLPSLNGNLENPIIFQKDDTLKIAFKQNDKLNLLTSNNGYNWYEDNKKDVLINEFKLFNYSSNSSKENINSKINHIYGKINDTITLYSFKDSVSNKLEKKTLDNNDYKVKKPNIDAFEDEYLKSIYLKTKTNINTILDNSKNLNTIREEIENLLYDILSNINDKNKPLDEFLEQLESLLNNYEEKNNLLMDKLKSIENNCKDNLKGLEDIKKEIKYIKEMNTSKQGIFKKLINIFK